LGGPGVGKRSTAAFPDEIDTAEALRFDIVNGAAGEKETSAPVEIAVLQAEFDRAGNNLLLKSAPTMGDHGFQLCFVDRESFDAVRPPMGRYVQKATASFSIRAAFQIFCSLIGSALRGRWHRRAEESESLSRIESLVASQWAQALPRTEQRRFPARSVPRGQR
jgi:hypothetical protein